MAKRKECGCAAKVNAAAEEQNALFRVEIPFIGPARPMLRLVASKPTRGGHVKPHTGSVMFGSHCPFCGKEYPS